MDEATNGTPTPLIRKSKKAMSKAEAESEIRGLLKEAEARLNAAKSARAAAEVVVRDSLKEIAQLKDRLLEVLSS